MTTMSVNSSEQPVFGKSFIIVLGLAIIGALALALGLSYSLPGIIETLGDTGEPVPPIPVIVLASTLQISVLSALATWGGLSLAKTMSTNVTPVITNGIIDRRLLWGLLSGAGAGIVMLIAHQLVFFPVTAIPVNVSAEMPPLLGLTSAFFYGGFTEEVLMRLGLMTLLLWIGTKIQADDEGKPSVTVFWVVNIIVTILFGLLHLPSAVLLLGVEISPIVVTQALVLNAVSILFGWLYWHKGIETAMASHVGVHLGYTLLAMLLL